MPKTYPLKYFCIGAGGTDEKSDKRKILMWMAYIPAALKDDISNKYEKLYGNGRDGGRGRANTFLKFIAEEFKSEKLCDKTTINGFYGQYLGMDKKEVVARFTKSGTKSSGKYQGKTILQRLEELNKKAK